MQQEQPGGTLAERVRVRRTYLGWSQRTLARVAGIPESSLISIERGSTRSPGVDQVKRIAVALAVSLDDLVPEPEPEELPQPGQRLATEGRRVKRSRGRGTVGSSSPIGGGATAARLTVNQKAAASALRMAA